jgi:V/A-type H+-transporting ATPase subunit G/H
MGSAAHGVSHIAKASSSVSVVKRLPSTRMFLSAEKRPRMSSLELSTYSPLAVIRDKERVLAQETRAAQARADARIADARARADAIKQQAEREGVRDAEALFQDGLARARSEADALRMAGEAQATALREQGSKRVAAAVEYIVQFVLPRTDK